MKSELVIPAVLVLAGIGVLVTYGLQLKQRQTSAQPTTTPTATQVAASTNSIAASTSPINSGGQSGVIVGGSSGDVVNVRSQASTQSAVVQQAPMGGRVQVLGNARGADGNRWYYVRLDNAREGWVHGDLMRTIATVPTSPTAPPSAQAILFNCQQRVERQLPGTQVQVSQGAQNSDGSFAVNWQTNTGLVGYCRVAANGNVVQYVNNSIAPRPTASPRTG